MARVLLGLGSNLGDRKKNLREAIQIISTFTEIAKVSSSYETEPVGSVEQPEFLNCALEIKTALLPLELLAELKRLEDKMGRVRGEKWGPRKIDVDIIFYEDAVIESDELVIPHPESHLRRFVLEPLSEISPDFIHPALGVSILQLLDKLKDSKSVRKAGNPSTLFPQVSTVYKQK